MFGVDVDVGILYCEMCVLFIVLLVQGDGVVFWGIVYGIGDQVGEGVVQFIGIVFEVGVVDYQVDVMFVC